MTSRLFAFLFILSTLQAYAQPPIEMHPLTAPLLVEMDGAPVAYYELILTNVSSEPQVLQHLTLLDTGNSATMLVLDAGHLHSHFAILPPAPAGDSPILAPGTSGLIYIEVAVLPKVKAIPRYVHILEVSDASGMKMTTVRGGGFENPSWNPAVLGAPVHGGPWAAVYEPSWVRGHRRVVDMFGGTPQIPGRFAIDFVLLDAHGKMAKGDKNIIANWHGYDADVFAVCDGRVVWVEDHFPESATLEGHPAKQAAGNMIVIELDSRRYVVYQHLKPKSIVVQAGQTVKRGDRIAAVGFTGQSTGPHLHLHVSDHIMQEGSEGLPFVFESFTLLGNYPGGKGLGERGWKRAKGSKALISQERPGPNSVISFP
jgi:murein DD-endopeptidase